MSNYGCILPPRRRKIVSTLLELLFLRCVYGKCKIYVKTPVYHFLWVGTHTHITAVFYYIRQHFYITENEIKNELGISTPYMMSQTKAESEREVFYWAYAEKSEFDLLAVEHRRLGINTISKVNYQHLIS